MGLTNEQYVISMVPPQGWHEIEVDPKHREIEIERQLGQLRYVVPSWRTVYPALRRYLVKAYADAWKSGVRYAIATDIDPDDAVQVMATFMIAQLPQASVLGDLDDELDAVIETLSSEQAELGDGEFMSLQKVNLPKMGTAVQAQSITSLVDDKGDKTDRHVASLRTFIPYGEHVFVVTGATPQIDIADVLFNWFASMTDTVSIEFVNSSAYASTSGEEIS